MSIPRRTLFGLGCRSALACLTVLFTVLSAGHAAAEDEGGPDVVRVEEDWELVLNQPSSTKTCPQFETVMSLEGNLYRAHARVTWNYREFPEFHGAGLQLQSWYGKQVSGHDSVRENELSSAAETITWTQVLKVSGHSATFAVANGHSDTWGAFGDADRTVALYADLPHLNDYSTDVSAANCRFSYGINRVDLIRIKEVRRYSASGDLLSRDSGDRVLYRRTGSSDF